METQQHVSSPGVPGDVGVLPSHTSQRQREKKRQQLQQRPKEVARKEKEQQPWWRRRGMALAAAAESFILPVGASLPPGNDPVAAALSVGCSSLLLQTPQALDDAVDALALQHRLSPDDSGLVLPPLKFSYVGAGLQPRPLPRRPALGQTTAAAAGRRGEKEEREGGAGEEARSAGATGKAGKRKGNTTAAAGEEEEGAATKREDEERIAFVETSCCSDGQRNTPSYDWLYALGCLNCGKPLTLAADLLPSAEAATAGRSETSGCRPHTGTTTAGKDCSSSSGQSTEERPAVVCSNCGHRVCPLHEANEPETLADAGLLPDGSSSSDSSSRGGGGCSNKKSFGTSDGVYLFGLRQQYVTGEWGKRFWQQRFLGDSFQQQQLQQRLRLVEAVGKEKQGVVCKDTCEKCGNKEAFYSSFQARSADEGMTVMYECTRCGHRRVLNT